MAYLSGGQQRSAPFLSSLVAVALVAAGCAGPVGKEGTNGTNGTNGTSGANGTNGTNGANGTNGTNGANGTNGTNGTSGGSLPFGCDNNPTIGLSAALAVSKPSNNSYFVAGEQPVITVKLTDTCGRTLKVTDVSVASLYVSGPRAPMLTKAALKLLNVKGGGPFSGHFIDLKAPTYADPSKPNLTINSDGAAVYTLAPVSTELPGTYDFGVLIRNSGDVDQTFPTGSFQLGTAKAETFSVGDPATSSCTDCHKAVNGKSYMAHTEPGFSPVGLFSIDQGAPATCKLCHNNDGYSPNPFLRKAHAPHRGAHQMAPGVAHPEYGLGADASLATYTNVVFPPMQGAELDCAKCHKDDVWKQKPSRLACGTCHDNVFFNDSGNGAAAINPPRQKGKPAAGACKIDSDCNALGTYLSCNTGTGSCERRVHPVQNDDTSCSVCHNADAPGLSPISLRHNVFARTLNPGYLLTSFATTGANGPNGTYLPTDTPGFKFKVTSNGTTPVADVVSNAKWACTAILSGPTDDMQRVYPSQTMKTSGTLGYDAASQTYSYTWPTPWPASAQPPLPLNSSFAAFANAGRPNPTGAYTMFVYCTYSGITDPSGASVRMVVDHNETVKYVAVATDAEPAALPRRIVAEAACNSCHVQLGAHGGSRRDVQLCSACHTEGATDNTVITNSSGAAIFASTGAACTVDTDCAGFNATPKYEACKIPPQTPTAAKICTLTADPTPGFEIDLQVMIHKIHFARKLDGYGESNNLINPGKYGIVGGRNSYSDLSEALLPQDVRSCQTCHQDTGSDCSATKACEVGQECTSGKCANTAWQQPTKRACLTCHDAGDAFAHGQLMTYTPSNGPAIESCGVCHGPNGEFAVQKVHNITAPYAPPYSRE